MEAKLNHESAWSFLKVQPDALLQFSMDISLMLLYLSMPLVHIVFLIVISSSQWTQLKSILNLIQKDLQLSGMFHRKCRKKCLACLLIMITVQNSCYKQHKDVYIYYSKTLNLSLGFHDICTEVWVWQFLRRWWKMASWTGRLEQILQHSCENPLSLSRSNFGSYDWHVHINCFRWVVLFSCWNICGDWRKVIRDHGRQ